MFHQPSWRVFAAGLSWTSRTLAAPWAGRVGHASVIDAAGAIYVIGGLGGKDPDNIYSGGTTNFNDVWADRGARAGLRQRGSRGVDQVSTHGGTMGYSGALQGVLQGY